MRLQDTLRCDQCEQNHDEDGYMITECKCDCHRNAKVEIRFG